MTDFFAGTTPAPHRLLVRVSPQGWRVSRNGIELAAGPETGPQGLQLAWKAAGLATAQPLELDELDEDPRGGRDVTPKGGQS